jgi:hypothetical protein
VKAAILSYNCVSGTVHKEKQGTFLKVTYLKKTKTAYMDGK